MLVFLWFEFVYFSAQQNADFCVLCAHVVHASERERERKKGWQTSHADNAAAQRHNHIQSGTKYSNMDMVMAYLAGVHIDAAGLGEGQKDAQAEQIDDSDEPEHGRPWSCGLDEIAREIHHKDSYTHAQEHTPSKC